MNRKIKQYVAIILSVFALLTPVLIPATTFACTGNIQNEIATGVSNSTGTTTTCGGSDITSAIENIAKWAVNILSIVVGIAAVIMIIYGGFRYITSGGESGSVESAKKTLIFAIIGLILVALAQIIVHVVLSTTSNLATNIGGFVLPVFRVIGL